MKAAIEHYLIDRNTHLKDLLLPKDPNQFDLGCTYVNGERVFGDKSVSPGDYVRFHRIPRRYLLNLEALQQKILAQEKDYLVVDKPSGLPVHATLDNAKENLQYGLEKILGIPLYVTHRLDVPTSGLIILAKTKEFQRYFNKLLYKRQVLKIYEAVVEKKMRVGKYIHFMKPSRYGKKEIQLKEMDGFLRCELDIFSVCQQMDGRWKLRIKLLTGRTHQIRAQLAFEGGPVLGDTLYQNSCATGQAIFPHEIALRAKVLQFSFPVGSRLRYSAR